MKTVPLYGKLAAGIALAPGLMHTGYGDHLRDELILNGAFGPETLEGS